MKKKRCTVCGPQPVTEFNWRNKAKGQLQGQCRKCHAVFKKQHYLDNKEKYLKENGERRDKNREEVKKLVLEHLAKSECIDCKVNNPKLLTFDHPSKKPKYINDMVRKSFSWSSISLEIEKSEVRCANCYKLRNS